MGQPHCGQGENQGAGNSALGSKAILQGLKDACAVVFLLGADFFRSL
jgi:hypothetical protein